MPKITVTQLDEILAKMQNTEGAITTAVQTLTSMDRTKVIFDENPQKCLPFNINHVLFDGCDMPIHMATGAVTVQDALDTLLIIEKVVKDMIKVLDDVRPGLSS